MSTMDDSVPLMTKTAAIKLPDHTQPSDYMDVQPKSYDPDFISQISSKMQVPHRIGVDNQEHHNAMANGGNLEQYSDMMVPDRIVLAVESSLDNMTSPTVRLKSPDFRICSQEGSSIGLDTFTSSFHGDNQHIEMRSDLALDLKSDSPAPSDSMAFVSLLTPPRTLTMNETFPVVDELEEKKPAVNVSQNSPAPKTAVPGNGHVPAPVPYQPGVNHHDSLLLSEEDETIVLRTQVAKLTRRVQVIEEEHQKRANRELILYPVVLGYILWKVLGWFVRDR